jgi:hypothetical protein
VSPQSCGVVTGVVTGGVDEGGGLDDGGGSRRGAASTSAEGSSAEEEEEAAAEEAEEEEEAPTRGASACPADPSLASFARRQPRDVRHRNAGRCRGFLRDDRRRYRWRRRRFDRPCVGFGCLFGLGFGSGLVVCPPVSVADGFGDLEVEEGRRRVWGAATAQPATER